MNPAFAPGKLFVAGEYAVVTPGEPAILIAVDRGINVTASTPMAGADQATITSALYQSPLIWSMNKAGNAVFHWEDDRELTSSLVTETIDVVRELAQARGIDTPVLDLVIESQLLDVDGRKYGLGSSGAVTAAVVSALDVAWGLELSLLEKFQLGLIATLPSSPRASGADIATSTLTGWVRYASPHRDWVMQYRSDHGVAALLETSWLGLELIQLQPPRSVSVSVGWTGNPADTDSQVGAIAPDPETRETFLIASRHAVDLMMQGVVDDDATTILTGFASSRDALLQYDRSTGGLIETPLLATLRTVAERHGAFAKPSGAGGGDCGIVLTPRHTKTHTMNEEWSEHGIVPLDINVYTQEDTR